MNQETLLSHFAVIIIFMVSLPIIDFSSAQAIDEDVLYLHLPPNALIISATPNPSFESENVTFIGKATDPDGTIVAYIYGTRASTATSAIIQP